MQPLYTLAALVSNSNDEGRTTYLYTQFFSTSDASENTNPSETLSDFPIHPPSHWTEDNPPFPSPAADPIPPEVHSKEVQDNFIPPLDPSTIPDHINFLPSPHLNPITHPIEDLPLDLFPTDPSVALTSPMAHLSVNDLTPSLDPHPSIIPSLFEPTIIPNNQAHSSSRPNALKRPRDSSDDDPPSPHHRTRRSIEYPSSQQPPTPPLSLPPSYFECLASSYGVRAAASSRDSPLLEL